jgi:LacI family transcriptional regulator
MTYGLDTAMSKITIEDISRHTGLSRGTVSRALNNRPDISLQTKQRVLEACRELNYVPSHAARSLATGRAYAVSLIVDRIDSPYATAYMRGALARAHEDRYTVYVTELADNPTAAIETLVVTSHERIDGLLAATGLNTDLARRIHDALNGRPIVSADSLDGIPADAFAPDLMESGRLVAQHLLAHDRDNILYLHQPAVPAAASQLDGFREVCQGQGADAEAITITLDSDDAWRQVRDRMPGARAIGATTDLAALQTMLMAREMGRRPGEDLGIIGQGNHPCAAALRPALTTIDFAGHEIGRRAMDMALQRIAKTRQDAPEQTLVAPQLLVRDTSLVS